MAAHVIDAFIVELGLDPTKFDQTKAKFYRTLQEMEDRTDRTSRSMSRRGGSISNIQQALFNIHHPILGAINQLENLSEAAQKSGSGIFRGMGVGAAGLSRLASAGIVAYGAVKAVQEVTEKIQSSVNQTAAYSRAGQIGGFSAPFASAAGIALGRALPGKDLTTNVTEWLKNTVQRVQQFQQTGNQAVVEQFLRLPGVNWYDLQNGKITPEELLLKTIGEVGKEATIPAGVARGQQAGLDEDLALAAYKIGGRQKAEAEIARARELALTKDEVDAANRLAAATQEVVNQFTKLEREMIAFAEGPLTAILTKITDILHLARTNPSELVKQSAWGLARGIFNPAGVGTSLGLGRGFPGAPSASGGSFLGRAWDWITGRREPAATAPIPPATGGTGTGHVAPNAEIISYIRQKATALGLNPDAIINTVSNEGLSSYVGDHGTSFGDFQLHTGGGMGDTAIAAGINIRDPSTWKAQTDFALGEMAKHKGNADWYRGTWHGSSAWDAANFSKGGSSALSSGALNVIDKTREFGIGNSWGTMHPEGMIIHHTGGRGSPEDVMNVLKKRNLGSQFIIDREGNVIQILPEGARGRHIMEGWGALGQGRSNANMQGVEIIANDDSDVTPKQIQAAMQLIKRQSAMYGYDPIKNVFGHGEVNPGHKQATEGLTVAEAVRHGGLQRDLAEQRANVTTASNDNSTNFDNDVHVGTINVHANTTSDGYAIGGATATAIRRQTLTAGVNTGLY